jgi:hypothetical protein
MERVYKGKVKGLRIIRTSAFGLRTWEVIFATGKAYFEYSMKKNFPFAVGDTIRFTANKMQALNSTYYQIAKVIDVNDCLLWDEYEQKKISKFILNN